MSLCKLMLRSAAVSAIALSTGCRGSPPGEPPGLVVINDNGAWCWYQDPRVVVDEAAGTLLVGSIAAAEGPGGDTRSGDVELVAYDLESGKSNRVVLDRIVVDDHDAPALHIRSDGRYLVMYSNHNKDHLSRYRISSAPHDAGKFDAKRSFSWGKDRKEFPTTYSNLYYLAAEGTLYDFSRGDKRSPNIMTSTDEGSTWAYGGKLTRSSTTVGYVNGYFKYASNGIDRIDVVGTEHHPRDYNTSIYHGIVRGGMLLQSDGVTVADANVFDEDAPAPADLTPVFRAGTEIGGEAMTHAWPSDVQLDADGNPHVIFTARAGDDPENTNFADHRFLHARFDGSAWHVHEIAKAGERLFRVEQDYTGLAAFNPRDLSTVYISSPIDPRDGTTTAKHEIYAGTTGDLGETWAWTPITHGSAVDNIRPVVAVWGRTHTAVVWLRGTMTLWQHYDMSVVARIFEGSVP